MPYGGSPSDCLDTTMDRFSAVRPIVLAAVFRRRSRHSRYMMTTITTVRRNAPLHVFPAVTALWDQGTIAVNLWGTGMAFTYIPLTYLPLTAVTARK